MKTHKRIKDITLEDVTKELVKQVNSTINALLNDFVKSFITIDLNLLDENPEKFKEEFESTYRILSYVINNLQIYSLRSKDPDAFIAALLIEKIDAEGKGMKNIKVNFKTRVVKSESEFLYLLTSPVNLTIDQAKESLRKGLKLTGPGFIEGEWVKAAVRDPLIPNPPMITEDGTIIDWDEFWNNRTGTWYKDGWHVINDHETSQCWSCQKCNEDPASDSVFTCSVTGFNVTESAMTKCVHHLRCQ